eukprot:56540_1
MTLTIIHFWLSFIILLHAQSDYIFQTQSLSWVDSEQLCLWNYGTHLASIHDTTQNNDATIISSNNRAWVGLNDINIEGDFVWTDGTGFGFGSTFYQYPWGSSEPRGSTSNSEDCVEINYLNAWNDDVCSFTKYSLCNYPPQHIEIINDPPNYERIPSETNIITTLDVLDVIKIEFDIFFNTFSGEYTSILHIGNNKNEQYPQISLNEANKQLTFSFSGLNGMLEIINSSSNSIELNTSYNIKYFRTQNWQTIQINMVSIYNQSIQSHSIIFDKNIYFNQPGYKVADAIIKNLTINTGNMYSIFNYLCDSSNRFSIIKGDWIMNDTLCSVHQMNITTTNNVIWLGDLDTNSLLWTDYKIESEIELHNVGQGGAAGIIFRAQSICSTNNCGQQYYIYLDYNEQRVVLGKINDGWNEYESQSILLELDTIYKLRVQLRYSEISIFLDNILQFTYYDMSYLYGSVGLKTIRSDTKFYSMRITFDVVLTQQLILQTQMLSWSDSEQLCIWNYGRHLASIHDTTQNNDANKIFSMTNVAWIGLNDIVVEGEFVWSDGTEFDFGTTFYQYPW